MLELWGVGDVALALSFLAAAAARMPVTLVAKPHAAPLLTRFCPDVRLIECVAPWTSFTRKYALHRWPWPQLTQLRRRLRQEHFALGVSARPDPRDHLLLCLGGARQRLGYPRAGSGALLTRRLRRPLRRHRADDWAQLARAFGWELAPPTAGPARAVRRVVIHAGAGQSVRRWPLERFTSLAGHLQSAGYAVAVINREHGSLADLLEQLTQADAFIGNDSGPGHLAAALGIPTFTLFGPQLPETFRPVHPEAAWLEGAPCAYKPCFDRCRYAEPHCLLAHDVTKVRLQVMSWLESLGRPSAKRVTIQS